MMLRFFLAPLFWVYFMTIRDDEKPHDKKAEVTPFPKARPSDLNPYLCRLIYNMDNCAGTNKSQYCFGGIALLVMSGHRETNR